MQSRDIGRPHDFAGVRPPTSPSRASESLTGASVQVTHSSTPTRSVATTATPTTWSPSPAARTPVVDPARALERGARLELVVPGRLRSSKSSSEVSEVPQDVVDP